MNAFTAKEHTCFYARVLDEDLPIAIDVLMRHGHVVAAGPRRRRRPSAT